MTWRMGTQNYEDIKWIQGARGKTKIVKCQDQESAGTTPEDENGIEGAVPIPRPRGRRNNA